MSINPWNSLEVIKILVSILTPILVAYFGMLINRKLKNIDFEQWSNQKITEKKLELYDEIAPDLNKLFCFYMWWGDWKEISPKEVIDIKRRLDRSVYIYTHLLGEKFFNEYKSFYDLIFKHFPEPGKDALIISLIDTIDGNRKENGNYDWDEKWCDYFIKEDLARDYKEQYLERKYEVLIQYNKLMEELVESIGLDFVKQSTELISAHSSID